MIQNYKNKQKMLTNQKTILKKILHKYLKKQHQVLNQLKIFQNKKMTTHQERKLNLKPIIFQTKFKTIYKQQ